MLFLTFLLLEQTDPHRSVKLHTLLKPKNSPTYSSLGLPSLWRAVDWQPRTWCPITAGDILCHLLGWGLSLISSLLALGLSLVPAIPDSAHCNGRYARLNLSYQIYFSYVTEGSSCSNNFLVCASNCPCLVASFPRDSSMHTCCTLKQYLSV